MRRWLLALGASVAAIGSAAARSSLPDPRLTPGALNPEVTEENIGVTICVPGWTRAVRPPEEYTYQLK